MVQTRRKPRSIEGMEVITCEDISGSGLALQQDRRTCKLIKALTHPQLYVLYKSAEFHALLDEHMDRCAECRHKGRDVQQMGYNQLSEGLERLYFTQANELFASIQD